EISNPLIFRKLVELRGVTARDQDAIALIILPWTEQGDRVRKLPDQLVSRERIEVNQLEAKRTSTRSHGLSKIRFGQWRGRGHLLQLDSRSRDIQGWIFIFIQALLFRRPGFRLGFFLFEEPGCGSKPGDRQADDFSGNQEGVFLFPTEGP